MQNKTHHMATSKTPTHLSDDELLRYSRQILLEGWDIDAQLNLKKSGVIIIGAGGLGCPASETLARAGVGHIHIIDDDEIEASNLQRQSLFTPDDIGQPKAVVANQTLQHINSNISVSHSLKRLTEDSQASLVEQFDLPESIVSAQQLLLLDCCDNFATRLLLNKLSVRFELPLLSAAAIAMSGQLALYEPYKQTGCYYCVFGDAIMPTNSDSYDDNTSINSEATCANTGVLASTTMVMGNLQANAALQFLGRKHNPLSGQLLMWSGRDMQQSLLHYQQYSQCPVCADSKA